MGKILILLADNFWTIKVKDNNDDEFLSNKIIKRVVDEYFNCLPDSHFEEEILTL